LSSAIPERFCAEEFLLPLKLSAGALARKMDVRVVARKLRVELVARGTL
jgi:hypothetical protein